MRFLRDLLIGLAIAVWVIPADAAYQPGAVVQLASVATLASSDYSNTPQIALSGYYTANDGGEGTLIKATCTPDGGSCFADSAGNHYKRTNLNGDVRQYGLTPGSAYDILSHPTTALDATPVLTAAFTALAAMGAPNVHTNLVSLYLGTTLTVPTGASLTCDLGSGGPYKNAVVTGRAGFLALAHGTTIQLASSGSDSTSLSNCGIIPYWIVNTAAVSGFSGIAFTYPQLTYPDQEAVRANMILAADTAITASNGRAVKVQGLYIYGFDQCVAPSQSAYFNLNGMWCDGNIGAFATAGGGEVSLKTAFVESYLNRHANADNVTCNPSGATKDQIIGVCAEEYWDIASIAASPTTNSFGQHICRITLQQGVTSNGNAIINWHPNTDLATSITFSNGDAITYPSWVANLSASNPSTAKNALGCLGTGPQSITVISSTSSGAVIDLVGSSYGTGSDLIPAQADTTLGSNLIRIVSGDINNIQPGESVTGTGIPASTTVTAVFRTANGLDPNDGYIAVVALDKNATASTSGSGDVTLSFDGGTFTHTDLCNGGNTGGCFFVVSSERPFAGASAGGQFLQNIHTSRGRHWSAAWALNSSNAVRNVDLFNFSHHYAVASQDSNNFVFTQIHNDAEGAIDDRSVIDVAMLGSSSRGILDTNSLAKAGIGVAVDLYSLTQSASKNTTTSNSITSAAAQTVTLAGSNATWPTSYGDGVTGGKLTVTICTTLNSSSKCDEGTGTEHAFGKIVDSTHVTLTARGIYNSIPTAFSSGAHIFSTAVQSGNGVFSMLGMGSGTTDQGLNILEADHGSVNFSAMAFNGQSRGMYLSSNMVDLLFNGLDFSQSTIYYDDSSVIQKISGCGNKFLIVPPWNCFSAFPINPTISSATTLGASGSYKCDATSADVPITVPAGASNNSAAYTITKIDASSHLCIITMSGSDTIGGAASAALAIINDVLSFKNDNASTGWVLQ